MEVISSIKTGSFIPTFKKQDGTSLTLTAGTIDKIYYEVIGGRLLGIDILQSALQTTTTGVTEIHVTLPDLTFEPVPNRYMAIGLNGIGASGLPEPCVVELRGSKYDAMNYGVPYIAFGRGFPVVANAVTAPATFNSTAYPTSSNIQLQVHFDGVRLES